MTAARILIDALAARFGGTAYAVVQLARRLATRSEVDDVIVLTRHGSIAERGLSNTDGVRCVVLPAASRSELVRRLSWQALRFPAIVARERCDVVISMSGMIPRAPGCPVICLLFNPVMYESDGAANRLRRRAVRRTALTAQYVAAPSRAMAELATASIGRECSVVPLGVDHDVFTPASRKGDGILCVADFYAHKRHDLILDAWLLLPAPRPRLHLVGNPAVDPGAHVRVLARVRAMPEPGSITLDHRLPLHRLVRAYHGARVFLLPSERESFCMPLLESMACGVPPIVRGLPSLRETGGAGARYVDSDDPHVWVTELKSLLENDTEYEQARRAAVRAAARFSWEAFTDSLLDHV